MKGNLNIKEYLEKNNIKASVQRIAIFNYLYTHRTHPNVDEIYNSLNPSMPTLSKTTVYNTLKLFSDNGIALQLSIDDKNVRYDAEIKEHSHFMCIKCMNVFDIEDNSNKLHIESEGFKILEKHVYYRGICKKCSEEGLS